ncbi:MAG: diacylglycerol kinase family protein [Bacteroidota bacterium]|nr:diacylglycerol kinase [Odoribacter sp.]MDP3643328.1 diacylglycerol kinase family protein [Bacteroidota bacterium]
MKDIFLIMNPGSHSGRSRQTFDKIIKLITQSGVDFEYHNTLDLDHATLLSRDANLKGYKTIVAVGGDGTINAVVNGFYTNDGHRISEAKFGVIYTGTSPDFNRSYDIPVNIDEAVDSILKGKYITIPVGMISFEPPDLTESMEVMHQSTVHYFVCCANIGLGAMLARKANGGIRRKLGDFWGTLLSLVGLLVRFKSVPVICEENGREISLSKLTNLSIGITPYIASGIQVPVHFTDQGKKFYRLIVQNLNLFCIVPLLRKVYSGKPFINSNYLSLDYSQQVQLSSPQQVEVEADGDPVGFLPCSISFAFDDLDLIS